MLRTGQRERERVHAAKLKVKLPLCHENVLGIAARILNLGTRWR